MNLQSTLTCLCPGLHNIDRQIIHEQVFNDLLHKYLSLSLLGVGFHIDYINNRQLKSFFSSLVVNVNVLVFKFASDKKASDHYNKKAIKSI